VQGARHVVVLKPLAEHELQRPEPAHPVPSNKRGGRK
jgi:rod shape-determining protein MreC